LSGVFWSIQVAGLAAWEAATEPRPSSRWIYRGISKVVKAGSRGVDFIRAAPPRAGFGRPQPAPRLQVSPVGLALISHRRITASAWVACAATAASLGVLSLTLDPVKPDISSEAAAVAMRYLGAPYEWGGATPRGFDSSGFVMYVYGRLGVLLPHYTGAQWNDGVYVPRKSLKPGDLVFFDGLGHVGIYIGHGRFIHAPHTGAVVRVSSLTTAWYRATYDGAKRIKAGVLPDASAKALDAAAGAAIRLRASALASYLGKRRDGAKHWRAENPRPPDDDRAHSNNLLCLNIRSPPIRRQQLEKTCSGGVKRPFTLVG
jgi:cell wall-associated NlpC family hydrolase